LGAVVSGQFPLKEGTKLKIAVGQQGTSRSFESIEMANGGAGGTFVVIDNSKNRYVTEENILLIAGELHKCTV